MLGRFPPGGNDLDHVVGGEDHDLQPHQRDFGVLDDIGVPDDIGAHDTGPRRHRRHPGPAGGGGGGTQQPCLLGLHGTETGRDLLRLRRRHPDVLGRSSAGPESLVHAGTGGCSGRRRLSALRTPPGWGVEGLAVGLAGTPEGSACPVTVPAAVLSLWGWPAGGCRPSTIS